MQVFHMKEAPLSLLDIFSACKERVSEEMFDNTRDTTTNTYRSKTYVVSTAPIEFNEESINDKANIEGHGSMLFFFFIRISVHTAINCCSWKLETMDRRFLEKEYKEGGC